MAQITSALSIREIKQILYSGDLHHETRQWSVAGVTCRRERHRYTGPGYAFIAEILQLRFSERSRSPWEALIVNERWATGVPEILVRGIEWMKLISGRPADVRDWIRRHRPTGEP